MNRIMEDLVMIAKGGDVELVKDFLRESCVDVNLQDSKGVTALMFASKDDNTMAVRCLIAAGADVNKKNNSGRTALMLAAESMATNSVRELIQAGCDVTLRDKSGNTALSFSCKAGNSKSVEDIVKSGGNVNVADNSGTTPLMFAAGHKSHRKCIHVLTRNKTSLAKADKCGLTGAYLCVERNHSQMREFMNKDRLGRRFYALTMAFFADKTHVHDCLEAVGLYLTSIHSSKTGVVIASELKYIETVQALLQASAQVNYLSSKGYTALMLAARSGNVGCVYYLLNAGASVNIVDLSGRNHLNVKISFSLV